MALPFDVIDTHVHLYPDKIAEKVTAALGAKFGDPPAFVATVASCAEFSEKSGIPLSLNLPVATSPDQVEPINRWAREIRGPRVLSLAAFLKLPFTDEERRLILAANARRLLGIENN